MGNNLDALTTIFTEFYYWLTVALMFLIHVGFCMYEVGASRAKNKMHTLMKNSMLIPLVTVTWFFFGWYIYWAVPSGPGITGPFDPQGFGAFYFPWETSMGTNLGDHISGVFWAAFLLFSWTAASIVSGAVIERIRSGAFWFFAVLVGSVTWVIDASWGWHARGWMVEILGYHDAYASGVIHAIAGGSALGILVHLGPRIGKFDEQGNPREILPHNPWLVCIGLFLIYTGFWGFYVACNVPLIDPAGIEGLFGDTEGRGLLLGETWTATTIYLTPTTLSAITMNFLMSLSGGMMAGYIVSKGDAFWTYSGGLAGIIAASAGNDLYHPIQAMFVGAIGTVFAYKLHFWVERKFKIDDAVGAVAVHGYAGFIGLVICGFLLWGHPSSPFEGYAEITPWGNFAGAMIMFWVLGFIPCWILAGIMKGMNLLRIPEAIELAGLDVHENYGNDAKNDELAQAELAHARKLGLLD